jgi:quinol monooxygenase YgiN
MTALAIWVKFTLQSDKMDRFLAAALEDARASVANEPGCRRFDVLIPKDEANAVYFYEIYDDQAALDNHRQQPHYAEFAAAVEETGAERHITVLTLQNAS